MSIWFSCGERFQRGRGIGGLLGLAKGLFKPVIQSISKAAKSTTDKAVGRALKNQAIETATNLATDILSGNSLKEGVEREVNNIKGRAVLGLQHLGEDKEDNYRYKKKKNKKVQNRKGKKKTKVIKNPVGKWVWFDDDKWLIVNWSFVKYIVKLIKCFNKLCKILFHK